MVAITLHRFTGMSPADGDFTPSDTRASICYANLRKRDIRPFRATTPHFASSSVAANAQWLLENPNTGFVFDASVGDGIIADEWNWQPIAYGVRNGVAAALLDDTSTESFYPAEAHAAPSIRVVVQQPATVEGIGTRLAEVAAQATPVNTGNVIPPKFITVTQNHAGSTGAYREYAVASVMSALDYVLNNYKITLVDGALPYPIGAILDSMLSMLTTQPTITRQANSTTVTRDWSAVVENSMRTTLAAAYQTVGALVLYEMTGEWPTSANLPVAILVMPASIVGDLSLIPSREVILPARQSYTAGVGVIAEAIDIPYYDGQALTAAITYAAQHWDGAGFASPKTAAEAALEEAAACRFAGLAGSSYVWNGLGSAALGTRGELQPYALGTETMTSYTEAYSAPVPRAYCYTIMDSLKREGRPSEPILLAGEADGGAAAKHFITVPIPPHGDYVCVYRALLGKDASPDDDLVWARVMTLEANGEEVEVPALDVATYATLTTVFDADGAEVPRWLCATDTGHAFHTDAAATTIYVSYRHKFWAYPVDRRITLPHGVAVTAMCAVGNAVYVSTNAAPITITVGEDHGDKGVDLVDTYHRHAPYPCIDARSHVATPWGCLYWSTVGLVMIAGVNVSVISASLIDGDQVTKYAGHGAYHEGVYLSFNSDGCYVFDIPDPTFGETPNAPLTAAAVAASAALVTRDNKLLLLPPNATALRQWDWVSGVPLPVLYRSYTQPLPSRAVFTSARVIGAGVNGLLRMYDDDGQVWEVAVTGNNPVRVPAHRTSGNVSIEFAGTCTFIARIEVASSLEELGSV